MAKILLGDKLISDDIVRPFLIVEAGVNHEGDLEVAKKMIEEAAKAGADAIKFQTYKAGTIASKYSPSYWDRTKEASSSQYELFQKYDKFWKAEYEVLARHCKDNNIMFMSTPFDEESIEFLDEMMPAYKIASADITNVPMLRLIARKQKPILLSTGASTIGEIDEAIRVIENEGNKEIALLHCVLSYPNKDEDANLNMIKHLKQIFPNYIIGYSDHTLPDESAIKLITAGFLGAKIIEKHYTLDKSLPGNDHYHAMDPSDIVMYNENYKIIEKILGETIKRPLECEANAIKFARRSLVAKTEIKEGEVLSKDMIAWKRPGTGIAPEYFDMVIGRKAKCDIKEDEILNWDMV